MDNPPQLFILGRTRIFYRDPNNADA